MESAFVALAGWGGIAARSISHLVRSHLRLLLRLVVLETLLVVALEAECRV
jgi:hypothetical protein